MIGLINYSLLLAIAFVIIIWRKWDHLRWLLLYALLVSLFGIFYQTIPFLQTYDTWALKRYLSYLLMLAAVAEIIRVDFRKKAYWVYPAYALIIISILFFRSYGTPDYYIPRALLFLGMASQVTRAISKKHLPLIGFSIIAIGALVTDALKLLQLDKTTIFEIQQVIDPFLYTISFLIILGGALVPAFQKLRSLLLGRPESMILQSSAAELVVSGREDHETLTTKPADLNSFESALRAAELSTEVSQKNNLSPAELGFYLGADEKIAETFVDIHKIEKKFSDGSKSQWKVRKSDVDKVLNKDTNTSEK